jgi:hypothetical protein
MGSGIVLAADERGGTRIKATRHFYPQMIRMKQDEELRQAGVAFFLSFFALYHAFHHDHLWRKMP